MVEGDIELLPSDHSVKYGQEVGWVFLFAVLVTKPVKSDCAFGQANLPLVRNSFVFS